MTVKELLKDFYGQFDAVNYAHPYEEFGFANDAKICFDMCVLALDDVEKLMSGKAYTHLAEQEVESYQLIENRDDAFGLEFLNYDFDEDGNLIGIGGDRNLERTAKAEGNVILYFELSL